MLHIGPHLKEVARKQVAERSERSGPSDRALTTVKGTALLDLQFRAQVEGHSFIADERKSAGGHDAGPAPMRYFVAGIMLCHKVWMVKTAAMLDLQIESLEGEMSWFNDSPIPRIVYKIMVASSQPDADIVKMAEGGASGCPSFKVMERAARIEVTLQHNGKQIFEKTYGLT
ncbi:MAG TPA: OsmC family protein [Alphaproteobacteria bacterium]|jgi:uncharacterized OsmC-like protein